MSFVSQIINGLSLGSIYALVAIGYTIVYGIVKLINFAHGDIIMVGSYLILFFMVKFNIPFPVAILFSMVLCAGLGVLIEKIAYKPLRDEPRINSLITAIGVSIFLQNAVMLIAGSKSRTFKNVVQGSYTVMGHNIEKIAVLTIVTAFVSMAILTLFVKFSKVGKAMRAVSEDSGAAALMGINVDRTISYTFAIGSALAVVGGALFSAAYPVLSPTMGSLFGMKAFIAAVIGGIGILPGAMVGGLLLGVVETITKANLSSQLSDAITFSILIVVLLVRPAGIFGKNVKEKV